MTTPMATVRSTFPAAWDEIEAAGPPFQLDPMHFPFPVSPLTASTARAFEEGYTTALREADMPVEGHQVRFVNHYRYERTLPAVPASEREAAAQMARVEASLEREIGRMLDRWYVEHRPRLLAHHERLEQLRPRGAARAENLAMLDEVDEIHTQLWTIHFRIAIPMLMAMQLFTEYHDELLPDPANDAGTLMAGTPSESMKAAFGLADLAAFARQLDLAALFSETPLEELTTALGASGAGRAFLAKLHDYLSRYGLRQDLFDLITPTWREDPAFALAGVRNMLATGHDPRAEHELRARKAQLAFVAARSRLASYPGAVWERYETMVQHARQGAFLQEEHNFYIDQKGLALLRQFYRQLGEHLTDLGILVDAEDVFMLRVEELRDVLGRADAPLAAPRVRALVDARRAELEVAAGMTPPPAIGDLAATPPAPDTPISRAVLAFFGGPPQVAEAPGQLRGNPGSRGVATGPARVARTLEEAKALRPGEVLVAITTMPAWTPLFGIAAAVVTETGGALSHCAIVAREYGVPAVVGAHGATRAIATGQRVTVDGGTGLVTIET